MQYFILIWLTVCSMVWGLTTQSDLETINKLQKKCIRFINFLGFRDHTNRYLCSNKIIKFYDIIQTNQVLFGYQFINKTLPYGILGLFIKTLIHMIITHDHNTRTNSNHALHIPMIISSNCGKQSLRYRILYVFNQFFRHHSQLSATH